MLLHQLTLWAWHQKRFVWAVHFIGKSSFQGYSYSVLKSLCIPQSNGASNLGKLPCGCCQHSSYYCSRFPDVASRRSDDGSGTSKQEYLCKWKGLPYSECTWDDSDLVSQDFQEQIDSFIRRHNSDCVPNKSCKVNIPDAAWQLGYVCLGDS